MRTAVIIPAYNEEQRLGRVLEELLGNNFEVIVVDDCSHDNTAHIAKQFPVYVAEHLVNQGQGGALRTGTHLAQELQFEIVAHFDADGQHRVEDLRKLVAVLEDDDCDIAIGSRFLETQNNLPANKQRVLTLAKVFSRTLLQLNFSDPQNGLRAFKLNVLPQLNWQRNDFQHCTEILTLIMKNNLRYRELPVQINYDEYSMSKKVRPQISMGWQLLASKLFDKL